MAAWSIDPVVEDGKDSATRERRVTISFQLLSAI